MMHPGGGGSGPHGMAEPDPMDLFSPRDEQPMSNFGINDDVGDLDLEMEDIGGALAERPNGGNIIDYSGLSLRNVMDGLQGKGPLASKRAILIGLPIMIALVCIILVFLLVLVIYPFANPSESSHNHDGSSNRAPNHFVVDVQTSIVGASSFQLDITRSYSPHGVDRFYQLVNDKYFDNNGIFRVVPNFVVQFGINGNPSVSALWETKPIPDDRLVTSNVRGTIAFATSGPNTRTTQLFINLVDNPELDHREFTPFGFVMANGMEVVGAAYEKYGEQPNQTLIYEQGNDYLKSLFPSLDYIVSMRVISES